MSVYTKAGNEKTHHEKLKAAASIRFEEIVDKHKIRDWWKNRDVVNTILNEMEDYYYDTKGQYKPPLTDENIVKMSLLCTK